MALRCCYFAALLFVVILQLSSAVYVDESKENEREELLKTLKEKWSAKSNEDKIREGVAGLPENRVRLANAKMPEKDELDCSIRYLAYNYTKKLLSASANFKAILDGLQLSTLCGITPKLPEKELYSEHKRAIMEIIRTKPYLEFYVDANRKSTSSMNTGSMLSPFKKIATAINACQYKRRNDKTHCIIQLRGGMHFLDEPITLTPKHNNILITKFNNENAVISGGQIVDTTWDLYESKVDDYEGQNAIFEKIKPKQSVGNVVYMGTFEDDTLCKFLCEQQTTCTTYTQFSKAAGEFANMCYARKDGIWNPVANSAAKSGRKVTIYVSDLSGKDIKPFTQIFVNGKREVRARFPNGDPETTGLHTSPTGYVPSALKWLPPKHSEPAKEIHIANPHRERTPFQTFYTGIGGPVSQYQPPVSYWGVKSPAGGGGATYEVPTGLQFASDIEFTKRNWSNASTGVVHAFQHYHWENWQFKLDSRNDTDHTLRWSYGGFQGARGSGDGKEWYVENIFEELDVPGEWFLDETKMKLYYFPRGGLPTQIIVPKLENLVSVIGSQAKPVKGNQIMGLSFAHTTSTFLSGYQVPSGGDWSVHRNAMVVAHGTENLTISGCTFTAPGGNGIFIGNYTRNATIADNYIALAGDNGIAVVGHTLYINGTNGDQPRGTQILRNVIHDTGVWGKGTYSYSQSIACQSHIEGNVFFNGPRGSININDGFGGGNTITKNVLFNFVRETFDHGPINTWDRVPYLTKVLHGDTASLLPKENFVTKCFIIGNYHSIWPIDHDDGSAYWADSYNFLTYGGWKNYLGHSKKAMQNVYIYPDKYASDNYCADTRGQALGNYASGYGEVYVDNTCISAKESVYRIGSCTEEHLEDVFPQTADNHYYTPTGKIVVECGASRWSLEQFQDRGFDVGTSQEKPVSTAQIITWGKTVLGI
eukprot:gene5521-6206_t